MFPLDQFSSSYLIEFKNRKGELKCNRGLCYPISVKQTCIGSFCILRLMHNFSKSHTCEKTETMMCWRAEHGQIAPQYFSLSAKDNLGQYLQILSTKNCFAVNHFVVGICSKRN